MESIWNHYYSIIKRILLFSGVWPYQEKKTRLFRTSFLTLVVISIIVPQVGKFIQCNGNMRCIMLTTPTCLLMFVILLKLYTCQFNNSQIKILIDHLSDDWKELRNTEEYEIMKTYAVNTRLFVVFICIYYHISAGMFISISLVPHILNVVLPLNESRPIIMPYEAYYFVDAEKYFFYIYFHGLISLQVAIIGLIAHDCILLVYLQHVCSIFAVAGFRFDALSRNVRNDVVNNNLDDVYDRKVATSVYAHWRALQFAELLEKTYTVSFFIQLLLITLTLTITLLQVTLQLNEVAKATRCMTFVCSQLTHLFLYSLQGQKLIDHSAQIRDKIYNSSWYNIPMKSQKLLLYVMRRSMQPNFLSAGKIYIFSLKSFTTVLQSSVSYFTVLASFQ